MKSIPACGELGASDPVYLCARAVAEARAGAGAYPLLPELAAHPDMAPFHRYLRSLPEESQMAVALRLEMPQMCDIYILDRTLGYQAWAKKNPALHAEAQAAKPRTQRLRLPPRCDELVAMIKRGAAPPP